MYFDILITTHVATFLYVVCNNIKCTSQTEICNKSIKEMCAIIINHMRIFVISTCVKETIYFNRIDFAENSN